MNEAALAAADPVALVPGGARVTPKADWVGSLIICRAKPGGRLIVAVVIPWFVSGALAGSPYTGSTWATC